MAAILDYKINCTSGRLENALIESGVLINPQMDTKLVILA